MYISLVALILPALTAYGFKIPIGKVPTKSKPHNFKILGKDIAVWWNKNQWSAIDDMCLHRQASLSKGVISKTVLSRFVWVNTTSLGEASFCINSLTFSASFSPMASNN